MSKALALPRCRICDSGHIERVVHQLKRSRFDILRCRSCATEFMEPQPGSEEIRGLYNSEYYKAWNTASGETSAVGEMKKATFSRRVSDLKQYVPGGRILDVGTAFGFFLEVARDAGFDPYGVEISEYSGGIAAGKFGADRIHIGTLETAPFAPGMFDAIAMSDLLEHVLDPIRILKLAHRLLRPGGVVLITTPNTDSLSRQLMGKNWLHYHLEHLFYPNPKSIKIMASKAGFSMSLCKVAAKTINLGYIHSQLLTHRHWALTPLITLIYAVTRPFATKPINLTMGDIAVILEKPAVAS
jgi:2-polyprenyl-3-methyl-5-hydroxy-6-metoxy-1,4-benzoquinol methylase